LGRGRKKNGLIDINLFPSDYAIKRIFGLPVVDRPEIDLEAAAGELLALLTSEDYEDITNQPL
jgi:hypothetical protein